MSIRTTVTLDDDVIERVKQESRSRGASFRETLNELVRTGLVKAEQGHPPRTLTIRPFNLGIRPGLNYDDIESLLEFGEGEQHR